MTSENEPAVGGPALAKPARVHAVLFRLRPDRARLGYLERCGLTCVITRGVQRTLEALRQCRASFLVLDAQCGSDAPERILTAIAAWDFRPTVLWAAPGDPSRYRRRAQRAGTDRILAWPEGVFGELAQLTGPHFATLRLAERVLLNTNLGVTAGGLGGYLVNLSATGALIELPQDVALGAELDLNLTLPWRTEPLAVRARAIRVQPHGDASRVGLQFAGISASAQKEIRDYVRAHNVFLVDRVGEALRPRRARARVSMLDSPRSDYYWVQHIESDEAVLAPRGSFVAPYLPGTALKIAFTHPHVVSPLRAVVVSEVAVGAGLAGGSGWRVRFEPPLDPKTLAIFLA